MLFWWNKLLIAQLFFWKASLVWKVAAAGNCLVTKSVMTALPGPPMVTHWPLVVTLVGGMVTLVGAMVTLLNFPKYVTPLDRHPFNWRLYYLNKWTMVCHGYFPTIKDWTRAVQNLQNISQEDDNHNGFILTGDLASLMRCTQAILKTQW